MEGKPMPNDKPTELVSTFLMVAAEAFANERDRQIRVDINKGDPDIISLVVGGFRITTVRDNWARIFGEFARVVTSEVVEVKVPTRTFRFDFNDTDRELKVVPE
jgi:hypothetical protein